MEESSHSTPSPMSSAASSQDSLHRNAATLHYHQQLHHQNPYGNMMTNTLPANTHMSPYVNKKKGVKSTLGRIFGKKDKSHQRALQAASAAASGVRSPAGMSLGSPQVFTCIFFTVQFAIFFNLNFYKGAFTNYICTFWHFLTTHVSQFALLLQQIQHFFDHRPTRKCKFSL